MIESINQETGHSIRSICETLGLPRSSYHHAAKPTPTQIDDQKLGDQIEEIFKEHRGRYGYRRIYEELSDREIVCGGERVRRLMKERDLRAIQPKTFVPQTSDGRADKPSENLVASQPFPESPNEVLVRCLNKFTMFFGNLGWGVRYVGCVRVSLLRKHFQAFSERCHGCLGPAFRAWFGFVVDDVFEIGSLLDREFLQSFPRFGRNLMAVVVY
jgi:hypothetical protein